MFVNDMTQAFNNCRMNIYVDDMAIAVTDFSPAELEEQMSSKLAAACRWTSQNVLTLNFGKTNGMVFGARRTIYQTQHLSVRAGETEIELVDKMGCLGVILDPS